MDSYLDSYVALNKSFKKTFTFRLGCDSGFFSEYNNMVLAILYCLKHGYQFNLSSINSNITDKGWSDFFLPFCTESTSKFHQSYNFRSHHLQTKKEKIIIAVYKFLTGRYLTQDLWDSFHSQAFENTHFKLPSLDIDAPLLEAAKRILEITWRLKPEIEEVILDELNQLKLCSRKFVGLHIRRGDKETEINNIDYSKYIDKIKMHTTLRDIFLATDDYDVYLNLKDHFPEFNFYAFARPANTGFDYKKYSEYEVSTKRKHLIDLFMDIEILAMSEIFVGTFSSNIGMYMSMRKGGKDVYGVDYNKWMIW